MYVMLTPSTGGTGKLMCVCCIANLSPTSMFDGLRSHVFGIEGFPRNLSYIFGLAARAVPNCWKFWCWLNSIYPSCKEFLGFLSKERSGMHRAQGLTAKKRRSFLNSPHQGSSKLQGVNWYFEPVSYRFDSALPLKSILSFDIALSRCLQYSTGLCL